MTTVFIVIESETYIINHTNGCQLELVKVEMDI